MLIAAKISIANIVYLDESKDSNDSVHYKEENPLQTTSPTTVGSVPQLQFVHIQPKPSLTVASNGTGVQSSSHTANEEDEASVTKRIATVLEEVVAFQKEERNDDSMGNRKFLLSLLPFMRKLPDDVNLEVRLQLMSVLQSYNSGKSFL
ncbi:hypothetical protein NQ318_018541 [Aromia moschata]|uniref:BESS domain-containing protein n=1 Tax=Aromia moschata TaxID=1265417 RepID=A0AAV8ZIB6_9CUCU|nr:hypothetical protein NQ318_018541 [Aromia moschata]